MTEYNVKYLGVLCTGAEWNYKEPDKFLFTHCGRNFEFTQQYYIDCSADTDHIRCVIEEQFLPWYKEWIKSEHQVKIIRASGGTYVRKSVGDKLELEITDKSLRENAEKKFRGDF